MTASSRSTHIDALRGLAVLLMVLVHAAATWEPVLSGNLLVFGLIVSAGGGLAAPLFVALLGWGLAQRDLTMQQRWWRAGCLFGCQGIVNVSSPHLFELFTPGVLSLLGVLIFTEPWWGRGLRASNKPTVVFSWVFGLTVLFCFVFTSWQGPSSWTYRVDTASVLRWFEHVVFTGLYPIVPWFVFASFGATVAVLSTPKRHAFFRTVSVIGLTLSLAILGQSQRTNQVWALPTGNAALTFFPANAPFLIAAMTGVAMLWWCLERFRFADRLSSLGRVSLTVYVLHFVPFAFFHQAETLHGWSPALTAGVVLGYTVGWIVLGTWLAQRAPRFTIESWMRRREPS